jgi:hypothetical protein
MSTGMPCSAPVLLHPVTLIALGVWAINDHLLKGWGPAGLTGKLSDVAALIVCPVVLLGIVEWCASDVVRRRAAVTLAACCAAIGLLLIGLELSSSVELAYQHTLSSVQYTARSLISLLAGQRLPDYALVHTTPDVTDLYTLPALAVPWWLLACGSGDGSR